MTDEKVLNRIKELQEEIRKTPYHKGTEHHIGLLKARVAQLRKELDESSQTSSGGGQSSGYGIKKQGDATVVLIGPPSAGKSSLLNKLTRARSKVGHYEFTTLEVIPGMMNYQGARVQILDVPGLITGAAKDKGQGKRILSVARSSDLIILMSDVERPDWLSKAKKELYEAGIRLNCRPPKIRIKKLHRGGIRVLDPYGHFLKETVAELGIRFGLKNAEIAFEEEINTLDDLIDAFIGNRVYLPSIEVINKIERTGFRRPGTVLISVKEGIGLGELKEKIWQKLGFVRVYFRESKNKEPNLEEPLILQKGAVVRDALKSVSQELVEQIEKVLIWGDKAKFPGQAVPLNYSIFDEIVIYFSK